MTDAVKMAKEAAGRVLHDKVYAEARERHLNDATQSGFDHHMVRVAGEHAAADALSALEQAVEPVAEEREKLAGEQGEQCERCQGNGEIVTDWDRYMHAHDGDVGDEAVADCPDCSGTGRIEDKSPLPTLQRLGQEFDAGEVKAYLYERGDSSFFEREMKPAEFYPNWKITTLYAHPPQSREPSLTVADAWQDLVDKDDRTSPEEYPDMALITREELADYMQSAQSRGQAFDGEGEEEEVYALRKLALKIYQGVYDHLGLEPIKIDISDDYVDDIVSMLKHAISPKSQGAAAAEPETDLQELFDWYCNYRKEEIEEIFCGVENGEESWMVWSRSRQDVVSKASSYRDVLFKARAALSSAKRGEEG